MTIRDKTFYERKYLPDDLCAQQGGTCVNTSCCPNGYYVHGACGEDKGNECCLTKPDCDWREGDDLQPRVATNWTRNYKVHDVKSFFAVTTYILDFFLNSDVAWRNVCPAQVCEWLPASPTYPLVHRPILHKLEYNRWTFWVNPGHSPSGASGAIWTGHVHLALMCQDRGCHA